MMKKIFTLIICFLVFLGMFPSKTYALPTEQVDAIQKLLDDAVRISGTPGISVAVVSDNQQYFFNSGHTSGRNSDNNTMVDEHTLYEIGSLSKAFTATGILLLEEQGLLSTTDRIEEYLPWFYVTYQNETAEVTLAQLLNHTSGLSQTHSNATRGEGEDMLQKTVEPFVGATLDFSQGTAYAYNNANYNILGLIIESVSGQSYEKFMKEQVFEPLGLNKTFLYNSDAIDTGKMSQGSRQAFFTSFSYDAPIYGGMKPSGFIISSPYDMARWMNIHLGLVQDIPEIFLRVVEKAHQADTNGPSIGNNNHYSRGWIIESDTGILGHTGQSQNFMSMLLLSTVDEQGVIFLANGRSVKFDLARNIKSILDGDLKQKYVMDSSQLLDIINSVIVIALCFGIVVFLIIGIRIRLKEKPKMTKSKIISISFLVVMTMFMTFQLLNYPNTVGSGWTYIFDWNPPSVNVRLFVMPIFFAVLSWFSYTINPKENALKK